MTNFDTRKLRRLERFHTEVNRAMRSDRSDDTNELKFWKVKYLLDELNTDIEREVERQESGYTTLIKE